MDWKLSPALRLRDQSPQLDGELWSRARSWICAKKQQEHLSLFELCAILGVPFSFTLYRALKDDSYQPTHIYSLTRSFCDAVIALFQAEAGCNQPLRRKLNDENVMTVAGSSAAFKQLLTFMRQNEDALLQHLERLGVDSTTVRIHWTVSSRTGLLSKITIIFTNVQDIQQSTELVKMVDQLSRPDGVSVAHEFVSRFSLSGGTVSSFHATSLAGGAPLTLKSSAFGNVSVTIGAFFFDYGVGITVAHDIVSSQGPIVLGFHAGLFNRKGLYDEAQIAFHHLDQQQTGLDLCAFRVRPSTIPIMTNYIYGIGPCYLPFPEQFNQILAAVSRGIVIVRKYGVATGLTRGRVASSTDTFLNVDPLHAGEPLCDAGDSGSLFVVQHPQEFNGAILGMLVQEERIEQDGIKCSRAVVLPIRIIQDTLISWINDTPVNDRQRGANSG